MLRALKDLLFVIPVAVTAYDNIGYPAIVEGPSMQPTLNPPYQGKGNDVVFINRMSSPASIQRNDITALVSPKDPNHRLIKRVIGAEKDVIETRRYKELYVDIPDGHLWVEGDNLDCLSLDSNSFGPVSRALVIGRASHVVWPPSRWQRLKTEDPLSRIPLTRKPMPNIL